MAIYNQQQLISASNNTYFTNVYGGISASAVRDLNLNWISSSALLSGSNTFVGNQTIIGNEIISGNLQLSGSVTASLQTGYTFVGDGNGKMQAVATSSIITNVNTGSFITTGSATNTIQAISGGFAFNTLYTTNDNFVSQGGGSNILYVDYADAFDGSKKSLDFVYWLQTNWASVTINGTGVTNASVTGVNYGSYVELTLSTGTVTNGATYTFTGPATQFIAITGSLEATRQIKINSVAGNTAIMDENGFSATYSGNNGGAGIFGGQIALNNYAVGPWEQWNFAMSSSFLGTAQGQWDKGPLITTPHDGGDIVAIGFQNTQNYTDGRVTFLTPISASKGLVGNTLLSGSLNISGSINFPNGAKLTGNNGFPFVFSNEGGYGLQFNVSSSIGRVIQFQNNTPGYNNHSASYHQFGGRLIISSSNTTKPALDISSSNLTDLSSIKTNQGIIISSSNHFYDTAGGAFVYGSDLDGFFNINTAGYNTADLTNNEYVAISKAGIENGWNSNSAINIWTNNPDYYGLTNITGTSGSGTVILGIDPSYNYVGQVQFQNAGNWTDGRTTFHTPIEAKSGSIITGSLLLKGNQTINGTGTTDAPLQINKQIGNYAGDLQIGNYNGGQGFSLAQYDNGTAFTSAGMLMAGQSGAFQDMYINGGNYDSYHIEMGSNSPGGFDSGVWFMDYDGSSYSPFMNVGTLGGNITLKRNTIISGSISLPTLPTGSNEVNIVVWNQIDKKLYRRSDISLQGAQGTQGATGQSTTGTQGPQGTAGTAGQATQGATGTQGAIGATGPSGSQGSTGTQGAAGQNATGTQGAQGATGTAGQSTQGAQGTTGTSFTWKGAWSSVTTYAVNDVVSYAGNSYISIQAGSNQNPLTATTYWTLMAAQGSTGIQGTQGTIGQAATGTQGAQGPAGSGGQNGTQGAQGSTGPQGSTGAQGANGASGTSFIWMGSYGALTNYVTNNVVNYQNTSYIAIANSTGQTPSSSPSYWQIMAAQGGVGATGLTGAQGAIGQSVTGAQGSQGYAGGTGQQGTQGATGANGAQGSAGTNGSQGATGAQGAPGSNGTNGTNGSNGSQGATGAQGATGQSITGAQGATGAQGSAGISLNNALNTRVLVSQGGTGVTCATNMTFDGSTLAVTGAITATGNITAYYSSDKRQKDNITQIKDALAKVKMLSGVNWDWNEETTDEVTKQLPKTGLIAQEVKEVLPEVVIERQDGYLAIDYSKMMGLIVEAIKELDSKIN